MLKEIQQSGSVELRRVRDRNLVPSYVIVSGGREVYIFDALILDNHYVLMEEKGDSVIGVFDFGGESASPNNETVQKNVRTVATRLLKTARSYAEEYARVNRLSIRDLSEKISF